MLRQLLRLRVCCVRCISSTCHQAISLPSFFVYTLALVCREEEERSRKKEKEGKDEREESKKRLEESKRRDKGSRGERHVYYSFIFAIILTHYFTFLNSSFYEIHYIKYTT
jgi:hypothetical protein